MEIKHRWKKWKFYLTQWLYWCDHSKWSVSGPALRRAMKDEMFTLKCEGCPLRYISTGADIQHAMGEDERVRRLSADAEREEGHHAG